MGVSPPYLFDTGPSEVAVRSEFDADITLMSLHGPWSLALATTVSVALRKCFSEHPRGLLLDLTGLDDESGRSGPAWVTAYRRGAGMDPPVPVAVCAPEEGALTANLRRSGALRYLPLYARAEAAEQALMRGRPLTDRIEMRLDRDAETPARARKLAQNACDAWGREDLAYPVQIVVSELVSNVLEHTATDGRLLMSRRGRGLHLAVEDHSRVMPRPGAGMRGRGGAKLAEGGRGLQIVHEASSAWGAMPTTDGKVVWAIIREDFTG
ncbi:ATP-binding protein [Actinoplanes sp. NPDC024001]|uniref:ATP-binding protein n=1 Tax=Actinoplanes sp. NPDC024001 TaxID=3154598 RepID=UPI0033E7AF28